ncbi:MAG: hypothetical protein ABIQ00_04260 [Chitinophagaceae bacterium]
MAIQVTKARRHKETQSYFYGDTKAQRDTQRKEKSWCYSVSSCLRG